MKAISGSIEVNTTTDWKWSLPSWGVSLVGWNGWVRGGRGLGGGIERRAECASRANTAPENRSSTRKPPPPHADPVLNTLLSMSQLHTYTHTSPLSRLLELSRRSPPFPPSPPPSVHLFDCRLPHVYLQALRVFPRGFVSAALSGSPACRVPPRSDRCCSSGCASLVPTCQATFYFG